jgi:hypothetical protein
MKNLPLSKKLVYLFTGLFFLIFSFIKTLSYYPFDRTGDFSISEMFDVFEFYFPFDLFSLLLIGGLSFFYLADLTTFNSIDSKKSSAYFWKLSGIILIASISLYIFQFIANPFACNDEACGGLAIIKLFGIPTAFLFAMLIGLIVRFSLKFKAHSKVFLILCLIFNIFLIKGIINDFSKATRAYSDSKIQREYSQNGNIEICFEQNEFFVNGSCYFDATKHLSELAFSEENGEICESKGANFAKECYLQLFSTIKETVIDKDDLSYCLILGSGDNIYTSKWCISNLSSKINIETWTVPD